MNSRQTVIIRAYERVGANDRILINKVLDRALALAASFGRPMNRLSLLTDLMITHATVGIRLDELLAADDGNFAHDVFGIERHLNYDTGELGDGFTPRFATGTRPVPDQDAGTDEIEHFLLRASDADIQAWASANNVDVATIVSRGSGILRKALARHRAKDDAHAGSDAGITWRIYSKNCVGITFDPTPGLSASELADLIVRLSHIQRTMTEMT